MIPESELPAVKPAPHRGLEVGQFAPQWSLATADGQKTGSFQYLNSKILLFFFRGTWCPVCRSQMMHIQEEWDKIAPHVKIVGIVSEKPDIVANFLTQNPLPFPLLPDPDLKMVKLYNVYQPIGLNGFRVSYPAAFIIDQRQRVRYSYVGKSQFDRPSLDDIILQLQIIEAADKA